MVDGELLARAEPGPQVHLRCRGACSDRSHGAEHTRPEAGWDGHVVPVDAAEAATQGGVGADRHQHHQAHPGRCREFVPTDAELVPDGDGAAGAQERGGDGDRFRDRAKKGLIELAYRTAEAAGIVLCTQDEAGPYQTVPYPGASWQPEG